MSGTLAPILPIPLFALVLTATACERQPPLGAGAASGDLADFKMWDSAGIQIVENYAPERPPGTFWTIDPEPEIVLGGDHGILGLAHDSAHLVWDVRGVARLADGRIAILSGDLGKLFLFEPSGSYSSSIGRKGRGPGEFTRPLHLQYLPGDTLVLWDGWFGSVAYFDTAGRLLRHRLRDLGKIMALQNEIPVRTGLGLNAERTDEIPLPDGSFLVSVESDHNPTDARLFRPRHEVVKIDGTYTAHSFGSWEGQQISVLDDGSEVPVPYMTGTSIAVGGRPSSVYIADGAKNEIRQFLHGR